MLTRLVLDLPPTPVGNGTSRSLAEAALRRWKAIP